MYKRQVRHLCFQFQHLQNIGDLPGDVVHGTEFQLVVHLTPEREIVCYPTIGRKNSSVCEDDSALDVYKRQDYNIGDLVTIEDTHLKQLHNACLLYTSRCV